MLIKLNKNVVIVCIYLNLFPKFYFICYSLHNFKCDQNGRSTRKNQIFDFLSVEKRSSISFPTTINNIVKSIYQIRSISLLCKFVRIHSTAHSDGDLIIHQNAYFAHGWRSHILLVSATRPSHFIFICFPPHNFVKRSVIPENWGPTLEFLKLLETSTMFRFRVRSDIKIFNPSVPRARKFQNFTF